VFLGDARGIVDFNSHVQILYLDEVHCCAGERRHCEELLDDGRGLLFLLKQALHVLLLLRPIQFVLTPVLPIEHCLLFVISQPGVVAHFMDQGVEK